MLFIIEQRHAGPNPSDKNADLTLLGLKLLQLCDSRQGVVED